MVCPLCSTGSEVNSILVGSSLAINQTVSITYTRLPSRNRMAKDIYTSIQFCSLASRTAINSICYHNCSIIC